MPVFNQLAQEYGDRAVFIAPAWMSSQLEASGLASLALDDPVRWGLDEDRSVFTAFGFSYQPNLVVISRNKTIEYKIAGFSLGRLREAVEKVIAEI